jgi:hypothetical protein
MTLKSTMLAAQLAEIKESIDGGFADEKPNTVDWSKQGVNAPISIKSDNVISAFLTIDQGPSGASYAQSFCCPFAVKNADGWSPTYVLNKPRIYGLSGANPNKLYSGRLYFITGEHLANTFMAPSLFLWDGTTPVDTSKLYSLPVIEPGGRGTGNTKDLKRETLGFKIPANIPAGNYYLIAFTNENRYGISRPKAVPVRVMGAKDPWLSNPKYVNIDDAQSGDDITYRLKSVLLFGSSLASESNPVIVRLPPGVFYTSATLKWPSNVGLVGAGINQTALTVNPSLDAVAPTGEGKFNFVDVDGRDLSVLGRVGLINLAGSNTYFADLTLKLSPDESRQTVRSIIVAGPGIDSPRFNQVRLESVLADEKNGGYVDGVIFRFGLHRFWDLRNCEYHCGQIFEGTNGAAQSFSTNGSFDFGLILGGKFTGVYGSQSGSVVGPAFGRGTLIYGLEVEGTRRGLAFSPGDYSVESTIACCRINTGVEFGNLESILQEARGGYRARPTKATEFTVTILNDLVDRQRWTAYIIDGKGVGQFRLIKSSQAGVHTLEEPWEIVPDETSLILFTQAPTNNAYVWNDFRSAGGITFFGSAFGCRVNSNSFDNAIEGVLIDTSWRSSAAIGPTQSGDTTQAAAWMSIKSNTFRDGCGIHVSAARDSADLTKDSSFPQVSFLTLAFNCYRGDVTNQLYACEGPEQNGNEAGPGIASINLIQYVSAMYETSFTTPNYLHKTIARTLLPRSVWFTSLEGVGDFMIAGHKIDDVPIRDCSALIATSADTKTITDKGYYSINDLVG